jgi:diguanylate cyclase (GGDEF)-like protein
MPERRNDKRFRTLKAGAIVFSKQKIRYECLVRNLSDGGACLQINSSINIPAEFDLHIDGEARPCRLAWLSDTRAGVEFKITEGSLTQTTPSDAAKDVCDTATLRNALNLVPIGLVLLDTEMRAQFINHAYRQMWQLPNDKADCFPPFIALLYHGRDTRAYAVRPDDIDRYIADRVEHVRSGNPKPLDLRLNSGEVIRIHCTPLPSGGRMLCYTYVTDLANDADELAVLRSSLDQMQQGIILLDEFLNARLINKAARVLWEIPDGELDRRPPYLELLNKLSNTRTHRLPAGEIDQYILSRLSSVRVGDPGPIDIPHKDGRVIRSHCAVLPSGGRMLTYNDVTDLVARAQQFEELARIDGLTGLYNRRHFDLLAVAEWKRAKRHDRPLSLMLIDVDRFKDINDHLGHHRGDEILKKVAGMCMQGKRGTDIVGRVGGDEFAVLLPETNLIGARLVAERLVSRTELLDGITLSVGIAEYDAKMPEFEMLVQAADNALYGAKAAGRNCIHLECNTIEFSARAGS